MPGEQASYSRGAVDRLVEGFVYQPLRDLWEEVDGTWMHQRSRTEETGDVESEAFLEVLDLERAIDAIRNCGCREPCSHREAALVLLATMHHWSGPEMELVFSGLHMGWRKALDKAERGVRAYLNGEDWKAAYRGVKRERER